MDYYQGEPIRHVGDLATMAADRYGDLEWIHAPAEDATVTFNDIDRRSNKVANMLVDNGLDPGDRVAMFLPNTTQFPETYLGIIKAGGVAVPLNLRMDPQSLLYVVQNAEADHLVGPGDYAEELQQMGPAAGVETLYVPGVSDDGVVDYAEAVAEAGVEFDRPERAYDDVAAQPYTSGTTGDPKGVLLTHENLLSCIESAAGARTIDPDTKMMLVLPLFHIYGLNSVIGLYLYSGGSMVMLPEPDPQQMLDVIEDHRCTEFAGIPAIYNMMWRHYREAPEEYDLSSLEFVACAAAPLADEVRRTIQDAWDVPMVEGWGMTECGAVGTVEPDRGVRKAAGCIGPPLHGIDLKLVDPQTGETRLSVDELFPTPDPDIDFEDEDAVTGEIAIRGPSVFEGYFKLPEKTEAVFDEDGWFVTGDIARVDDDGYLWMVDRADDMIITGGENVYPTEVEDPLYEHPDVAEAAVVAAPHEVKGEAPVAFVVREDGTDLTERELREFSLDHVPSYAHPRRVFFVDELPRSASQKVQRYELEEEVEELLDEPLQPSEEL